MTATSSDTKKKGEKTANKVTPTKTKRRSFEERLAECKAFRDKHNHCKIPTTEKYDKSLGIWVQEIRRNYKLQMTTGKARKTISAEQIASLDAIGFHWGFEPAAGAPQSDEMWETSYEQARKYHEAHGNFDIPADYEDAFLAEWVCVQRDQKKRRDSKMKCNINKQRIQKLDEIDFNWDGPRKLKPST
jgi:hypothetical protein